MRHLPSLLERRVDFDVVDDPAPPQRHRQGDRADPVAAVACDGHGIEAQPRPGFIDELVGHGTARAEEFLAALAFEDAWRRRGADAVLDLLADDAELV